LLWHVKGIVNGLQTHLLHKCKVKVLAATATVTPQMLANAWQTLACHCDIS